MSYENSQIYSVSVVSEAEIDHSLIGEALNNSNNVGEFDDSMNNDSSSDDNSVHMQMHDDTPMDGDVIFMGNSQVEAPAQLQQTTPPAAQASLPEQINMQASTSGDLNQNNDINKETSKNEVGNNMQQRENSHSNNDSDSDEENVDDLCIICTEKLTSDGEHQISTLKCGHIFGWECLSKWLAQRTTQRCPTCNKPAKKRDIVRIYAQRIRVYDKTKLDLYKRKYQCEMAEKVELLKANAKLNDMIDSLKMQLMSRSNLGRLPLNLNDPNRQSSNFVLSYLKTVSLRDEGTRFQAYSKLVGALVASISKQPKGIFSSAAGLNLPQHGVSKLFLGEDGTRQESILIHHSAISEMSIDQYRGELITLSRDRTLKITSLFNKNEIASLYNAPWMMQYALPCEKDSNILLLGLSNKEVIGLDRRRLSSIPVFSIQPAISKPILSMCEVFCKSSHGNASLPGLMVTSMDSAVFVPAPYCSKTEEQQSPMPFQGLFTSCDFEARSGLTLLATRTTPNSRGKQIVSFCFTF